jgi:hypothetical protein
MVLSSERMNNSKLKTQNSKLLAVLLLAAALSWSEFGIRVFLPALKAPHWPTPASWIAARLALEGHADLIYADRPVFFQQAARLGAVPDIFEANMPTTVLVFLPLATFTESTAYKIWDVGMILCYILACAILFRSLGLAPVVTLGLWALAPAFHPWRENIGRGQVYPLLLLLLVLGAMLGFVRMAGKGSVPSLNWARATKNPKEVTTESGARSGLRRADLAAGAAFGLIAVDKFYYAAVLLLPALLWRRGRLLLGAIAFFALAAAITLALWGGDLWVRAIGFAISWRDRPESAVTAYQTLNSLLTHLLRYDATWNRGPVANLPGLVGWLWWSGAVVMLAATGLVLWTARSNYELRITNYAVVGSTYSAQALLPLALMVPVALVLAPVAEDYHFVLTLFPLVIAGRAIWDMYNRQSGGRLVRPEWAVLAGASALLVAALLLGAPWHFNVPSVGGWHSLLYYPRLYGALLLWGLIMGLIIAARRSSAGLNSGIPTR